VPRIPPGQLSTIQQAILACTGDYPAQFSRSALAKLLAGSHSTRAADLAGNPYYGRLSGHGRKAITFEIDILLQQGFLALDGKGRLFPAGITSQQEDRQE
jgi:hypothetical protein